MLMIRLLVLLIISFPSLLLAAITLNDDQPVDNFTPPQYYKFNQTRIYWAVAGVRPASGTDWDLRLYSDTNFTSIVASSMLSGSAVDFVVTDCNHSPLGWYGLVADRYSGGSNCRIEYEDDDDIIPVPGADTINWPFNHVAHVWDLFLTGNRCYNIRLDMVSGNCDFGMALFRSNGAAYYAGRTGAVRIVDVGGSGSDEVFNYTAPATDWYGLVVWANNSNSANFVLRIQQVDTLFSGYPVENGANEIYYKYRQTNTAWSTIGVWSPSSGDYDIFSYDDTLFNNVVASSNTVLPVDFVLRNNDINPIEWSGVEVTRYSGSGNSIVEYKVADGLGFGRNGPYSWSSNHIIQLWSRGLLSGETYRITADIFDGSSVDLGIGLYRSSGTTRDFGRQNYVALSDAGGSGMDEYLQYTPDVTGSHCLVAWRNNPSVTGNFYIWLIPQYTPLTSGTPVTNSTSTKFYRYYQNTNYWAGVGIRSPIGSDWDLTLYDDTLLFYPVAHSVTTDAVDFVVGDFNHADLGNDVVQVRSVNGIGSCRVEYEDGAHSLTIGDNGVFAWDSNHIIKVWDIYLPEDETFDFTADITSGSIDLGIAIFKSNGTTNLHQSKSDAQAMADNNGNGGDESFRYTAPESDWYGVVVFCNNANSGNYYIRINPALGQLTSGEVVNNTTSPRRYKYNQHEIYWSAVGVRPASGSDWDIMLYLDTLFTQPAASSGLFDNAIDFVIGDYNHSPLGWEGVHVNRYSGTGSCQVQYVEGDVVLPNGHLQVNWPANNILKVYDIYRTASTRINVLVTPSSGLDIGVALFQSNGSAYYAGRTQAVTISDNGGIGAPEAITYVAPNNDYYGLVVWANNNTAGTITFDVTSPVIEDEDLIPAQFALSQSYPNPFNSSTIIKYDLPVTSHVQLTVFDILGRKVAVLVDETKPAGHHQAEWNAADMPSGVYFCRIQTDEFCDTKQMLLLK